VLSIGKMVAGAERYYLSTVADGREEYHTGIGHRMLTAPEDTPPSPRLAMALR
jgi:hypothetical protein